MKCSVCLLPSLGCMPGGKFVRKGMGIRLPRFFIKSSDVRLLPDGGKQIEIAGRDAVHIARVLRTRIGERLTVCDSEGVEYDTVLVQSGEVCVLHVEHERPSSNEPPYRAVIYQALAKGDKMETVIQKGTELGGAVFVPVVTKRCVVRLDEKDGIKKAERWQRIAEEAAKQCGRAVIPTVSPPVPFKEALAASEGIRLFCYEGEGTTPLSDVLASAPLPTCCSVFIGPEGGFDESEVLLARSAGASLVGLGPRILRTETASAFVLSCLSFHYER